MPKFLARAWSSSWLVPLLISIFYVATHVYKLTSLPVFADESIYIRWSQLIISDAHRYLFFSLNDGKTPFFIWLMVPFELLFKDPLWAGRFASVSVGLLQIWLMGYLVKVVGGRPKTQWLAMFLTASLPFWFFYQRQALIDSLMVLFLTVVMIAAIRLVQIIQGQPHSRTLLSWPIRIEWAWVLILGVSWWAALMTKLPAILILPVIGWWVVGQRANLTVKLRMCLLLGAGVVIGGSLFGLLKFVPGAGQIFSRGSDFLFPISDVLFHGKWKETLPNLPAYFAYFWSYTHPLIILGVVGSLFVKKRQRLFHLLFWSMVLFGLPMEILGKVVYARYFLSLLIWLTVSFSLFVEYLYQTVWQSTKMGPRLLISLVIALSLANIFASAGMFMYYSWYLPNQLPLVPSDKIQYLTEWSSGHGIVETVAFLRQQAANQTVAVATEGYFGTLPDALNMYFFASPDPHVYIEGIGQPVRGIPDSFRDKAQPFAKKYLVVNSHRMDLSLPPSDLVTQFCRPDNAPCLQIWDITQYLATAAK